MASYYQQHIVSTSKMPYFLTVIHETHMICYHSVNEMRDLQKSA